jgi:hypothetical protein
MKQKKMYKIRIWTIGWVNLSWLCVEPKKRVSEICWVAKIFGMIGFWLLVFEMIYLGFSVIILLISFGVFHWIFLCLKGILESSKKKNQKNGDAWYLFSPFTKFTQKYQASPFPVKNIYLLVAALMSPFHHNFHPSFLPL